jgi:hypothetical protein
LKLVKSLKIVKNSVKQQITADFFRHIEVRFATPILGVPFLKIIVQVSGPDFVSYFTEDRTSGKVFDSCAARFPKEPQKNPALRPWCLFCDFNQVFTREYVVLERVFILLCCCSCCCWDRLFYLKSNFTMVAA